MIFAADVGAEFGQAVFHFGRDGFEYLTVHEAIPLECLQGLREHALADLPSTRRRRALNRYGPSFNAASASAPQRPVAFCNAARELHPASEDVSLECWVHDVGIRIRGLGST